MSENLTIEMSTVQSVQFTRGEDGAMCPLVLRGIGLLKLVGSAARLVIDGFSEGWTGSFAVV
jgi:hypothetical protein